MRLPLVGGSYTLSSLAAAAQESINIYPEAIEDPNERGKNRAILRGIPGYHLLKNVALIDAGATPIRGLYSGGGRCFVAAGTKIFEVDSAGALVGSVYTIADDSAHTPVQMFVNGNQMFIVASGLGYCWNDATGPVLISFTALAGVVNTAAKIVTWVSGDTFDIGLRGRTVTINGVGYTVAEVYTDIYMTLTTSAGTQAAKAYSGTPVLTAGTGAFLDGYFLVSRPGSNQFNFSHLREGTLWDAIDNERKESYPDNILWIYSDNEQLYVSGTESGEVWQTDPTGVKTFVRLQGAATRTGAVGAFAPASMNAKLYYLGGSPRGDTIAYRLDGFTPVRISTHGVEEMWRQNAVVPEGVVGYSYVEDGHFFWVLWFGGNTDCWVYDATASAQLGSPQWHQRAIWDVGSTSFLPYRPQHHTFIPEWGAAGQHIVGDWANGNLYIQSNSFYDANGADIKWRRALPYQYNDGSMMYFGRMELEMDTGEAPSGTPTIDYDYSDDRGHTFSTPVTASIGAAAAYSTRVVWPFPTGSSRGRVVRFAGAGQGKVCIVDAIAEVQMGSV